MARLARSGENRMNIDKKQCQLSYIQLALSGIGWRKSVVKDFLTTEFFPSFPPIMQHAHARHTERAWRSNGLTMDISGLAFSSPFWPRVLPGA